MMDEKLLIVDDQGDLRKMLRIGMGYGKYQIFDAEDGETALELVDSFRPDVVLLDVMMPGKLDGFAVCRALKEDPRFAHIFIVLITARGAEADFEAGRQAGADAYVVKPFRVSRLIEVVEGRKRLDRPVHAYAE